EYAAAWKDTEITASAWVPGELSGVDDSYVMSATNGVSRFTPRLLRSGSTEETTPLKCQVTRMAEAKGAPNSSTAPTSRPATGCLICGSSHGTIDETILIRADRRSILPCRPHVRASSTALAAPRRRCGRP